ncbi:MAG: hypothetical protein AB1634_10605 [Thermodesulfobacteriota bacterium]
MLSEPGGIVCGRDCGGIFNIGTEVTLTAAAFPGSAFDGWSGAGCSGLDPCTVLMDRAQAPP